MKMEWYRLAENLYCEKIGDIVYEGAKDPRDMDNAFQAKVSKLMEEGKHFEYLRMIYDTNTKVLEFFKGDYSPPEEKPVLEKVWNNAGGYDIERSGRIAAGANGRSFEVTLDGSCANSLEEIIKALRFG